MTWESVLLSSLALLEASEPGLSIREQISMACAMISAFDLYARGGDMVPLMKSQVTPPIVGQRGAARCWTITFFPEDRGRPSKAGSYNHTKTVGTSLDARHWVAALCPLLLRLRTPDGSLLGLTARRYLELFHRSKVLGNV